jgi:hypothetical protein
VTPHFEKVNITKFVKNNTTFLCRLIYNKKNNYFNKKETMLQQDPKNVISNIVTYQNRLKTKTQTISTQNTNKDNKQ